MKRLFIKAMLLLCLCLLTACGGQVDNCTVAKETYGSTKQNSVTTTTSNVAVSGSGQQIDSNGNPVYGKWTDTNVYVNKGDQLDISVTGRIVMNNGYGLQQQNNNNQNQNSSNQQNNSNSNTVGNNNSSQTGANNNQQGSNTNLYQNNGLGVQYVMNPGTNTQVYYAKTNQTVVVTIPACQGEIDTQNPTNAWTYNNAWARCVPPKGHGSCSAEQITFIDAPYSSGCNSACNSSVGDTMTSIQWVQDPNNKGQYIAKLGNINSCWNTNGRHLLYTQGDTSNLDLGASNVLQPDDTDSNLVYQSTVNSEGMIFFNMGTTINSELATQYKVGSSNTLGQYTFYVKVEPWVIENGQNLKIGITSSDPNMGNPINILPSSSGSVIAKESGYLWLKVEDPDTYTDNSGSYDVSITSTTQAPGGMLSSIVNYIEKAVSNILFTASAQIFKNITCINQSSYCLSYLQIIRAMIMLYIVFYAITFLMGMTAIEHSDLIMRLAKIGLILFLTGPDSWNYFSTNIFNNLIAMLSGLISSITGSPGTNPFGFIDTVTGIIFDPSIWNKISAMLFFGGLSFIFGLIPVIIIIICFWYALVAIYDTAISYIKALIAIALLISLAPIFIPFVLFTKTKTYFDTWCRWLLFYVMEPVIVILLLSITSVMLSNIIISMFSFSICTKYIAYTYIMIDSYAIYIGLPGPTPWGVDNDINGQLTTIFNFMVGSIVALFIAHLMHNVCKFGSSIAQGIMSAWGAPSAATGFKYLGGEQQHGGEGFMKKSLGLDRESTNKRTNNKMKKDEDIIKAMHNIRRRSNARFAGRG
jgi:type IV secretory pathway VirB6-like protein